MKVTNYIFRLAASGESLFLASAGATVAQRLHGAGEQGLAWSGPQPGGSCTVLT